MAKKKMPKIGAEMMDMGDKAPKMPPKSAGKKMPKGKVGEVKKAAGKAPAFLGKLAGKKKKSASK